MIVKRYHEFKNQVVLHLYQNIQKLIDFDFSTIIVASVDIPSGIFNLIQIVTLQAKLDREMASFRK